tara:strand:+ start:63 stop:743 length:681 start_codon:yes stop_codon:yes gene_type:complete
MNWQDIGFLISKNKYNENSAIAEFFTNEHGKVSGLIFGATSKKIKNYLFLGNKFHINYYSKSDNSIGSVKLEIDEIKTPKFLNDKHRLLAIIYITNLIKILTVENQSNKKIYDLLIFFFDFLENDNWLTNFIFLELEICKNVGYDIDFKNYVKKIENDQEIKFIVESNNKIIPNFLINKNFDEVDKNEILQGFKIVGDFLNKTVIQPNNINFPQSRNELINSLKLS